MQFHKILPEAESSSRCTNVVVWIPKVWGEEKCAKVPFSHWKEMQRRDFKTGRSVQTPNPNVELSYLSHSHRTFALSLHLSFLAVLLHFLLQLLLLLGWAVLLLARLPASLPVQKERLELLFYSWLLKKCINTKRKKRSAQPCKGCGITICSSSS